MADGTSTYFQGKQWTDFNAADDLNVDSDNDVSEFVWPFAVDVYRVMAIPTTAVTNATGTVDIEIYKVLDYSDGGNDTLLGTWQLMGTTTIAVGTVTIGNFVGADTDGETAEDGLTRYEAPQGPYEIGVGESLVLKVVEPADAGVIRVAIEYAQKAPPPISATGNVARVYNVPGV